MRSNLENGEINLLSVGKSYKEYQKCTFNKIWGKSRHSHASVFWGQKGQGPLEKPQEITHYMFAPDKKNLQDFQNQRYIGIFMSQRER
jgi:hypothetical protein